MFGVMGVIIMIEYESGFLEDFKRVLKELILKGVGYFYDRIDDNVYSYLRVSLFGVSECFLVVDGRLVRGMW